MRRFEDITSKGKLVDTESKELENPILYIDTLVDLYRKSYSGTFDIETHLRKVLNADKPAKVYVRVEPESGSIEAFVLAEVIPAGENLGVYTKCLKLSTIDLKTDTLLLEHMAVKPEFQYHGFVEDLLKMASAKGQEAGYESRFIKAIADGKRGVTHSGPSIDGIALAQSRIGDGMVMGELIANELAKQPVKQHVVFIF